MANYDELPVYKASYDLGPAIFFSATEVAPVPNCLYAGVAPQAENAIISGE